MARPLTNTITYFSHDTDMSEDEKIEKLEFKFGLIGFAVYVKILEKVYKTSGSFNIKSDDDYNIYSMKWKIETEKLYEIINFMREINLFPTENFISSGVKKRMKKIKMERDRKRNYYKKKEVTKKVLDVQNTAKIPLKDVYKTDFSKQIKLNKIKLNKTKEEEEREKEESHLPEIKIETLPDNKIGIPILEDFLFYSKTIEIYQPQFDFQIKAKYEAWKENGWKDGNNSPIKNWKTKLKNTMPYFKSNGGNNGKNKRSASFVSTEEFRQDVNDLYEGRKETIFHQ